ncbi:hypothetical protein J2W91_004720 [Paenibacillus amylolyticus]|uniref:Uncharacterized protein n=1 Tax=Paenibacillus amylolyticus TaxID=1451 RepID=A0AAP5LT30_PAEAM|nr:hypothetical protein [Paenibacillus amylolyticus]
MLARAEVARQRARRQIEAKRQQQRKLKKRALIYASTKNVLEVINIYVATTHRIPRQQVLNHSNQTDKPYHRVDK